MQEMFENIENHTAQWQKSTKRRYIVQKAEDWTRKDQLKQGWTKVLRKGTSFIVAPVIKQASDN